MIRFTKTFSLHVLCCLLQQTGYNSMGNLEIIGDVVMRFDLRMNSHVHMCVYTYLYVHSFARLDIESLLTS